MINLALFEKHADKIFYIILSAFFFATILSFFEFYPVSWDERVYIESARYISSGGEDGFVEDLRPLGFPLFLTIFKDRLDNVFFLRTLNLILSVVFIVVLRFCFQMIIQIFDERYPKIFSAAAALLVFSFPEIYHASTSIDPEILSLLLYSCSTWLVLTAYLKKESRDNSTVFKPDILFFLSGILLTYAFFTRFLYGAYLLSTAIFASSLDFSERRWHRILSFLIGASIVFLLFSSLHYSVHEQSIHDLGWNPLFSGFFPMINQLENHASGDGLWLVNMPFSYYLDNLLLWKIFLVFFIPGLCLFLIKHKILRKDHKEERKMILTRHLIISLLFPLLFLSITPHKEFRYIIMVVFWIFFFTVFFLMRFVHYLEEEKDLFFSKSSSMLSLIVVLVLVSASSASVAEEIKNTDYSSKVAEYQFLNLLSDISSEEEVLVSTPLVNTSGRLVLAYYDDSYFEKLLFLKKYDYVYYSKNLFICMQEDDVCLQRKKRVLERLNSEYELIASFNSDELVLYKRR